MNERERRIRDLEAAAPQEKACDPLRFATIDELAVMRTALLRALAEAIKAACASTSPEDLHAAVIALARRGHAECESWRSCSCSYCDDARLIEAEVFGAMAEAQYGMHREGS